MQLGALLQELSKGLHDARGKGRETEVRRFSDSIVLIDDEGRQIMAVELPRVTSITFFPEDQTGPDDKKRIGTIDTSP